MLLFVLSTAENPFLSTADLLRGLTEQSDGLDKDTLFFNKIQDIASICFRNFRADANFLGSATDVEPQGKAAHAKAMWRRS